MTTDSNENPSGPIELSAGIVEGSSKATTRTTPTYQALTPDTKLALQVSGTWVNHSPNPVVQTTTATSGTDNAVNFTAAETLYWDDYGTADANNTTGRTTGLTIYSAAINGKTTTADAGVNDLLVANADWTALSWTLPTDQRSLGSQPADKDLLISNNVKASPGEGTYKFTEKTSGKLLKFTHALSKITVVLTAGAGFTDGKFDSQEDEEVMLTSNEAYGTTNAEWALITGNVNITNGDVDITSSGCGTPSSIIMHEVSNTHFVVTKDALVMPDSHFSADNAIIARINADGNIYYVTAKEIRTAINANHASDGAYSTEAGKNYIINVTVDKTGISHVSATVTAWSDVDAEAVAPKINVIADWGGGSGSMTNAFSFYRSTSFGTGYGIVENTSYYKSDSEVTYSETWTMSPTLYWPDHNTHYQFRAVWPQTVTTTGNGTGDDGILDNPRVIDLNDKQVIKVKNVAYSSGSFPSDLKIARPEVSEDAYCNNSDHTPKNLSSIGICATEGTINLNFRYMMSQVEVNLSTTSDSDPNYVNLSSAKVELISVYNYGYVKLGDRRVDFTGFSRGDYTLNTVAGDDNENKRWSAIVPQTFSSTKFKITIYKNGVPAQGVDDIYYADISDFTTDGWTAGNHYVYNLTVTKTDVQVSATLTNWSTVNASHSIWF